ncbi:MAG: phosphate ABC transporter substrate-binding protein PstS [Dehalococcoidales bacterium]|nr:phosphate ABC transporter substrate-binding protein PstS [Dehalococcoidales bacterium]
MKFGFKHAAVGLAAAVLLAGCTPAASPTSAPTTAPAPTTAAPTANPVPAGERPQGEGLITGPFQGEANSLNGAGATFPQVLYTKWFSDYAKLTGVEVNYQGIGSGGGIKAITDKTVDFGASDAPLTDQQLKDAEAKGGPLLHIPTTLGGVALTYNVPGVSKQLKVTPETLSGIFLGKITKWNDPKLLADNPDAGLPNADIVVVHRSDGSGTTNIFTDYLSAVSPDWKSSVGMGTSVNWPVGLGEKGNPGVANGIKQNPNSIGYVEVIYAIQNKLATAQLKNKAGKFVDPNLEGVSAAAAGVAKTIGPDLRASIVNADGDGTYPIAGFTYLLVYQKQTDKAKATALTRLTWWGLHDGQKYTTDLGYAPLPKEIQTKAEDKVLSITVDGQQAFPGK